MPRQATEYERAEAQGLLWTPRQLGSSLVAWWNASRIDTFTVIPAGVTHWADLSGNGHTLVNTATDQQPDYVTNPSRLYFDTAMSNALLATTMNGISGSEFVLSMACLCRTNTSTGCFSWPNVMQSHLPWSGVAYYDGPPGRINAAWGGTFGQLHVWSFITSVGRSYRALHRDGNVVVSSSSASTLTASGGFTLGNYSAYYPGDFCEIVIHRATDIASIERVEGYLAHPRGIASRFAAAHPYRNCPPLIFR